MVKSVLFTGGAVMAAAIAVLAQQGQPVDPARTPGIWSIQDPNRDAFVAANCRMAPAPAPPRGGGPGGGRGGRRGGGPGGAPADLDYTVTAIPDVIAAGARWTDVWKDPDAGNADGFVGLADGSLLIARDNRNDVVRLAPDGATSVVYRDTYTGGALAMNARGQLFVAERALSPAIWLLAPERRLFANTYRGESLDCVGPNLLNDLVADNRGGVYMTFGGVYYANPQGIISGRYGTVVGNGIILSRDEKTLYVTGRVGGANGPGLVAFDVQPDGSLTNERQFADAGADGTAIDTEGRLFSTGNNGLSVISPDGTLLGFIPAPVDIHTVAFGGPDKRTLFAAPRGAGRVMSIRALAQGFQGRPK